jgi:hypothetical protein
VRVASRHIPKFVHRPLGLAGWAVLSVLAASLGYVALVEPKLVLAVLGSLGVLFWLAHLHGKRQERTLLALASARDGQTICEFARDFDARAVDTWIIRAVYEQLQGQLKHIHPAFPVRAEDRLKEDLLLDDDDLEMNLAQEVEQRTGRSLDGSASNPYFGKVRTVRDFVLFFQAQPKSNGAT